MKKTHILSLMLLLLIPSLAFAQTSSSKDVAAANRSWPSFIAAFRVAVKKRDRVALKKMIAIPFITQVDGELNSPEDVFKWLDGTKSWGDLQKAVAPRSKSTSNNDGARPKRWAGIFDFEFGRDGRWRISGQSENE
jgi:hypothetical protein